MKTHTFLMAIGLLLPTIATGAAISRPALHPAVEALRPGHHSFYAHTKAPVKTAPAPSVQVKAATQWLALVDAGTYDKSWQTAAAGFQKTITQAQWIAAVTPIRDSLGPLKHRTLMAEQHAKTLPGAPDGDYDVLTYATTFAKKSLAVETVTLTHESTGAWRVAGYFIR